MRARISLHAAVRCRDGQDGRVKEAIVEPDGRRLTHIVVREHALLDSERLVPFEIVEGSSDDEIRLRCTSEQMHRLDNYLDVHFLGTSFGSPLPVFGSEAPELDPIVISEKVPEGEIAVGKWSLIEATDGPIGRIGAFIVDMDDGRISHVVVFTHHFLSHREVLVPIDHIERFHSGDVQLAISRRAVEQLGHASEDALSEPSSTQPKGIG